MDFYTLLYHDILIPLLCPGLQRDLLPITDKAFRYTDICPVKLVVVIARPNTFYLFIYLIVLLRTGYMTSEDMVYALIRNFEPVLFCQMT